jgi:phosphatidylserine/phosphatidylglycerophosphate/cardiolipin synthase-like enzyme
VLAASRGDRIDVETETISTRAAAYSELKRLAGKGVHCRLLLSSKRLDAKTRDAAKRLCDAGVTVRAVASTDKLAIKNGRYAWVGSANATSAFYNGDQTDWGLRTHDSKLVRAIESRFDANWRVGRALSHHAHTIGHFRIGRS